AREIDGAGLALAPGFIDVHTHYDCQLFWDPSASPSPWHGVTTVVTGNCGFTIAPCRAADRETLMQLLLFVEGMPIETLRAGIAWSWEDFPAYLDALAGRGVGPDVAADDHRPAGGEGRGAAVLRRTRAREREDGLVGAASREPVRARRGARGARRRGGAAGGRRGRRAAGRVPPARGPLRLRDAGLLP